MVTLVGSLFSIVLTPLVASAIPNVTVITDPKKLEDVTKCTTLFCQLARAATTVWAHENGRKAVAFSVLTFLPLGQILFHLAATPAISFSAAGIAASCAIYYSLDGFNTTSTDVLTVYAEKVCVQLYSATLLAGIVSRDALDYSIDTVSRVLLALKSTTEP